MRCLPRIVTIFLTCLLPGNAFGNGPESLKAILAFKADLLAKAQAQARKDAKPIDFGVIASQVKSKALESVKGIDLAKVDPKEAFAWAQVFNYAGSAKDAASLAVSFIMSKPDAIPLYEAQKFLIGVSFEVGDDKTVLETLTAMKPFNAASSVDYASLVITCVLRSGKALGADKEVEAIDKALAGVSTTKLTPSLATRLKSIKVDAIVAKIELYREAGQKDKALKVIEDAAVVGPEALSRRLELAKNQLNLVGSAAPPLKSDHLYGKFDGLEGLKGKVVLVVFFAHWLNPAIDSLSGLSAASAELESKGLVVIGVTKPFGFYTDRSKHLTEDEEVVKVADYLKQQKVTWPMIFGGQPNFTSYGVSEMPTFVVIDRRGLVREYVTGYSATNFADLRKRIETLLEER